jgi:hypothetical protein
MVGTNELVIGLLLLGAILLIVLYFALRTGKKSQKDVTFQESLPDDDPLVTRDEFQATPIAEAVEERVRQKIAEDPSFTDLDVDFGTSPDGGLEIWVDAVRYTSVEEIPDGSLRETIREAVRDYNAGL